MNRELPILVGEDDPNDALFLERAIRKCEVRSPFQVCEDGESVIAYLAGEKPFEDRIKFPFPYLLILDIKMPKKSGMEVLKWLGDRPECRVVPTVMLSSSREDRDIREAYQFGASAYFTKPSTFEDLVKLMRLNFEYWAVCELPTIVVTKC